MKSVICLLVVIAGANAGIFLGGLGLGLGGGSGVNGGWSSGGWSSGGWSGGYGGGWNSGRSIVVPETKYIKVIEAPAPIVQPAPVQIVKVIRDAQPVIAPAWKIVKVIEQPSYSGNGWAWK